MMLQGSFSVLFFLILFFPSLCACVSHSGGEGKGNGWAGLVGLLTDPSSGRRRLSSSSSSPPPPSSLYFLVSAREKLSGARGHASAIGYRCVCVCALYYTISYIVPLERGSG